MVVVDGFNCCLFNVIGGVEVWFVCIEVDDVLVGCMKFCGFVGDCEGGRGFDSLYLVGKLKV